MADHGSLALRRTRVPDLGDDQLERLDQLREHGVVRQQGERVVEPRVGEDERIRLVAGAVGPIAASGPMGAMAAVLLVGLPAVVYAFLVGIWAIRMFQGAYAGSR